MGPSFEFATSQRIVFGRGRLDALGELAGDFGRRALLVHGEHLCSTPELAHVEDLLARRGIEVMREASHGEPDVATVDDLAALARDSRRDLVIGLGGGSIIDVAKAVAGIATNGGSVRDYLEGVGTGRRIERAPLALIAIPTTAGTGSEATRNAVISSRVEGFKKSIRSQLLLPAIALVDPALTDALPPAQTAASGLDALTQLIEPYVSNAATPLTDALALEGIRRAARALPRVHRNGADREARDDMALASLLGGICLANAGLGAVHGIAAALGAHGPIPHGLACACVLAQSVDANIRALERRAPASEALRRYATVAEAITGRSFASDSEARRALVDALRRLTSDLAVPPLAKFGFTPQAVPALVKDSRGSSMRFNPIVLEDAEIESILRGAL